MELPFTAEQFMGVFAAYNAAVWPAQVVLSLLALLSVGLCFRDPAPVRSIALIVSLLWAWNGIVYHWLFFSEVNPAAKAFAILFLLQSLLFVYYGVIHRGLQFRIGKNWSSFTGGALVVYGLALYPLFGYFLGHIYPASPTFGAPCPTTIFTFGILVWTAGRVSWVLLVLPLLWSVIGFSAALQLGMREDPGLIVSGVAAAALLAARRGRRTAQAAV